MSSGFQWILVISLCFAFSVGLVIWLKYFERPIAGEVLSIERVYELTQVPYTAIDIKDDKGQIYNVAIPGLDQYDFGIGSRLKFRRRLNISYVYMRTEIVETKYWLYEVKTTYTRYYELSEFKNLSGEDKEPDLYP